MGRNATKNRLSIQEKALGTRLGDYFMVCLLMKVTLKLHWIKMYQHFNRQPYFVMETVLKLTKV